MPDLVKVASIAPAVKPRRTLPVRRVRFSGVEAEDLVDENGLPRDGYDYSQHMKEMGQGKFYSATSRFDAGEAARALSRKVELPSDALPSADEQDRLLQAITLTTNVMDDDLREALVNDEAFEELDDSFMMQAAEENVEPSEADDFDYDAHIAKLMEAASGITPLYRGNLTDSEGSGSEDDDECSDGEGYDDDEDEAETLKTRDEAQRVLDELFEKTLADEYADEQLGELDEDDPETRGKETLDGELLDAVVEDYVFVQQELADAEGKLGNPLREGNRLKQVLETCEAERYAYEYDEGAETEEEEEPEDQAARTEREKKELQELYERNQYLQREEHETWDCETIVSTYSTLSNHPTVLREATTRRKKKKQPVLSSTAEAEDTRKQKVTLSRKTGMPLGVFEAANSLNKAETSKQQTPQQESSRRPKGETKEQRRLRKAAVKMEKMTRRAEKKDTKLAFKEEEARQSTQTVAGRVSVFRY
uniref:Protein LTV1 homolog n=1 Tax=Hyaloperonospora arabidopsidis (strain Emoy2) TaxID=559515 RepID=M4BW89_HYAAE